MTTPSLTQPTPPWVVFTAESDPWVSAEATPLLERGGLVFRLNARDLLEPASLFCTFARELSFPQHFGHNWDALEADFTEAMLRGRGLDVRLTDPTADRRPEQYLLDRLVGLGHLHLGMRVYCSASVVGVV
ncbi:MULTISPECIES: barstar family protein [unclassified Streptomyces]|uniref:barstar family protein n=1 Tax=unclassified Streptomyces TaxID=2593676 RepID=UPI0037FB2309